MGFPSIIAGVPKWTTKAVPRLPHSKGSANPIFAQASYYNPSFYHWSHTESDKPPGSYSKTGAALLVLKEKKAP
jgi:hypothetical protein